MRYVLHDFAKADAAWLEPLLDAVADAAPRLAAGDPARFLTDVARATRPDEALPNAAPASPVARDCRRSAPSRSHPAGERQSKRGERAGREPQAMAEGPQREELIHGLQMRHRGTAERRQVHPLQCADADGRGRGRQLSFLHHRAQRR